MGASGLKREAAAGKDTATAACASRNSGADPIGSRAQCANRQARRGCPAAKTDLAAPVQAPFPEMRRKNFFNNVLFHNHILYILFFPGGTDPRRPARDGLDNSGVYSIF